MNELIARNILTGTSQALTFGHPIVSLKDGQPRALEMLTRFLDGQGRIQSVGHLLDDRTLSLGLRVELDLRCVGTVFAALVDHPITDHLVFININPMTLEHPLFWKRIQPWLWDLPIPPHRIVLEVTETYGMHDLDRMEEHGRRLRELGVRVAVDDLGSGSASLSHMARLAPDFIKVDRSLICGLDRHPYQAALVEALSRFSERMRVTLIAEGVETMEELQAVVDADVPWGQGFLFGQPEPLQPAMYGKA
jgi:EAL domain-containing protein (putative c-di-GMP-specific phosphodiesterase class I)